MPRALTLHSPGPICTGLTGPGARVPRESLEACTLAPAAIRAIREHAHPSVGTHKMGEEGHSFVLQHLRGHLLLRGHSERPASWKGLGIRQAEGQVALGQSGASLSSAEAGRRGEGLLGQAGPLESREGGSCAWGALVGPERRHYRRDHLSKAWGWEGARCTPGPGER